MANPFAGMVGANMPGPMGNIGQIVQAFNQFKSTFNGDPQQTVQQLLNSGKISQDMLNQAQQMAGQLKQFMK